MAVVNGHVEVLRWARQDGCPWTAYTRDEAAERFGCADDFGNLLVPGPARGAGALQRQGQPLQGPAQPAQPSPPRGRSYGRPRRSALRRTGANADGRRT